MLGQPGIRKQEITVVMPYIGKDLSVNYYKIVGRGGAKTNRTKKVVRIWMGELADKVRGLQVDDLLTVSLLGKFVDNRVPDLANLHKVVGDAIMAGIGVDDKYYRFVDKGYSTGHARPVLEITLTGGHY